MEQKFKIGDKVYHKSGLGPTMVVIGYDPKDGVEVTCQWFDKDNNIVERSFHQDTIELSTPSEVFFGKPRRNNYY